MIHHRHIVWGSLLSVLFALHIALVTSCSSDEDAYPNIVAEMADIHIDQSGKTSQFELDNGKTFSITNPLSAEKMENKTLRALVEYVPDSDNKATLYNCTMAHVLSDSTATPHTDPVKVLSVWRTDRYINLHLAPLTQGSAKHGWGIITDSIVDGHYYTTLHHNQNGDPTSYTTDVYASLPIERSVAVTLRIKTVEGTKTFEL